MSNHIEQAIVRTVERAGGIWSGQARELLKLLPGMIRPRGAAEQAEAELQLMEALPRLALRAGVTGIHIAWCPRAGWLITLTATASRWSQLWRTPDPVEAA